MSLSGSIAAISLLVGVLRRQAVTPDVGQLVDHIQASVSAMEGLFVGLLDISKARGNVFLDRLDELLQARGVTVRRYRKPTFTRPAPLDLAQKIAAECHLVVEGLAD